MSALAPKQARFVQEYLLDLNATQAAIRAGYSAATAESQGSRLLSNAKVSAAVQEALDERAERAELKADKVINDIRRIAKNAEKAGELGVALKGHELLGKHLKLFTDKVEHSGGLTLEQLVAASQKGDGT